MHSFQFSRLSVSIPYRRRTQMDFLHQNAFFFYNSFTSVRLSESDEQKQQEESSFAVSYLSNSCRIPSKRAIEVSKRLRLNSIDKPNSVRNLLKNYGFSETQISTLVGRLQSLILADAKATLLPKIEFFKSIGVSSSDLPRLLITNPRLLKRSLENNLIPCYQSLKSVLIDDEKVISAMKHAFYLYKDGIDYMVANVKLLREFGVPQSHISLLVTHYSNVVFTEHRKFVEATETTKEIGFDPLKATFILAIQVIIKMKKLNWESRLEVYRRWGWSRDDTLLAFRKQPHVMLVSEEKINKMMDFLLNKMGWPSECIARYPTILSYSLEKRIMPRCSVVQILKSKGLVNNDLRLGGFMGLSEKVFLKDFVTKFLETVPLLLNVYEQKMLPADAVTS
ncbi:Mitochondrial transcription termination factor family protein [Quillaja saponaria]|uniref:Mitochondrial transcription termination factor family protein n=1 Tax=Quillaja saponaria TaxID=32244 RepID=A0AAD7PMZ2_QUISA|nr:Mitochondrial transcription termination factor family protein [Quillaja saponaria]KAJ7960631.1 Mitochondrial transcription termination factor family protein [Quillaja saponaria]